MRASPARFYRMCGLLLMPLVTSSAWPQKSSPAAPPAPPAQTQAQTPGAAVNPKVAEAEALIGRALILRGFPAGSELAYDAAGHAQSPPAKMLDWTLCGMDLASVAEKGGELDLEGTRVAVRYNPDAHTFDRHPLKAEHLRIRLAEAQSPAGIKAALLAVFSVGIDPALQRSMPEPWRHYFEPAADWGADRSKDPLAGVEIVRGSSPAGVTLPVVSRSPPPEYTEAARVDKVEGAVLLRLVVDAQGVPRRIAITRPLGYGLDAEAAASVARWRFQPGTRAGVPVAVEINVTQQFTLNAPLSH